MEPGRPLVEFAGFAVRNMRTQSTATSSSPADASSRAVGTSLRGSRAALSLVQPRRAGDARGLVLVVRHGVAIRRLIARRSALSERVLVGRRPLLLQAAEHAQLDRIGVHR
jgi:hypothetical protein